MAGGWKRTSVVVIAVAAAFVVGAVGNHVYTEYWPRGLASGGGAVGASGTIRTPDGARIGGPFRLVDHDGRAVTESDYHGTFLLIVFGYTSCPDVCPTELQVMSQAMDRLGGLASQVRPIFVTIDPARDTVAVLKDYMVNFHARFVGLTGSEAQIAAVAKAYRVYYAKARQRDAKADDDYLMNHSSYIYLMDPAGELLSLFRFGTKPERMAERIRGAITDPARRAGSKAAS